MRKGRPNDPTRKDRIRLAALEVIADEGIHATTHRKIAERAEVPLGSLTYYFSTLDDLFVQAFTMFGEASDERWGALLAAAPDAAAAKRVLVDAVCGPTAATPREMRLIREMYSYGSFSPAVAALIRDFERESRQALQRHFSEAAARALDALVEGWMVHQSWDPTALDRRLVEAAIDALADLVDR